MEIQCPSPYAFISLLDVATKSEEQVGLQEVLKSSSRPSKPRSFAADPQTLQQPRFGFGSRLMVGVGSHLLLGTHSFQAA